MIAFAEYIWLDGTTPTQTLRSKTRIVELSTDCPKPADFPQWSFDGSSTGQAEGSNSDCALLPVCIAKDPNRSCNDYLVLCEVYETNGALHDTNTRAKLRHALRKDTDRLEAWIGFEQEYTLFQDGRPLGFPKAGFPEPQGRYYCGVGADRAFGRHIAEAHAQSCVEAGLIYYGLNAEVMPGQWEFQVGYRGIAGEDVTLINICDHLWIARYLLQRVAENHNIVVSFDNKPVKGDWNGAGLHTNFSTNATRGANGLAAINDAIEKLRERHADHIVVYGDRLEERLTGSHETCAFGEFRSGNADRGASIRIPPGVERAGAGYFEDRRPGANADPYHIAARLIETVSGIDTANADQSAA